MLHLRLVKDFWAMLRQEVCRGRLVAIFEAAHQHRIQKTLAFLNTEVLHTMMRVVGARVSRCGVTCFMKCQAVGYKSVEVYARNQLVWIQWSYITRISSPDN